MLDCISREAAKKLICGRCGSSVGCIDEEFCPFICDLNAIPAADVCSTETLKQVMWERDAALAQLAEIGKGLGEKMDDVREVVLCGNCYLHDKCATEDVFKFARLSEENRFCGVGSLKRNGAQMEAQT